MCMPNYVSNLSKVVLVTICKPWLMNDSEWDAHTIGMKWYWQNRTQVVTVHPYMPSPSDWVLIFPFPVNSIEYNTVSYIVLLLFHLLRNNIKLPYQYAIWGSRLARWAVHFLCLAPACETVHDQDRTPPQPGIATPVELQMHRFPL